MTTADLTPAYTGCQRCFNDQGAQWRKNPMSPAAAGVIIKLRQKGANDPLIAQMRAPFYAGWYAGQAI